MEQNLTITHPIVLRRFEHGNGAKQHAILLGHSILESIANIGAAGSVGHVGKILTIGQSLRQLAKLLECDALASALTAMDTNQTISILFGLWAEDGKI